MENGTYTLHRRARIALQQLPEQEQVRINERLNGLAKLETREWLSAGARLLPGEPSLFLVNVDDILRLFVLAAEGQKPELQDVVRKETLEQFARQGGR